MRKEITVIKRCSKAKVKKSEERNQLNLACVVGNYPELLEMVLSNGFNDFN